MMGFRAVLIAGLLTLGLTMQAQSGSMPTPILKFDGVEEYEVGGQQWIRYRLSVVNWASFETALFAPSPNLPPCGSNTKASRAWVDIFDGDNARLYGFCALASKDELTQLWFSAEKSKKPPSRVYIIITDRLANATVTSNQALIRAP